MAPAAQELLDLLRIFKGKLSADVYQDLHELITEGEPEPEVALGSLCEILFEQEIPVHETSLEKIKSLASRLEMPPAAWSFLQMK